MTRGLCCFACSFAPGNEAPPRIHIMRARINPRIIIIIITIIRIYQSNAYIFPARSVVASTLFAVNDDCIIIIIHILIHLFRMCMPSYAPNSEHFVHFFSCCCCSFSPNTVSLSQLSITANSILNFIHHHVRRRTHQIACGHQYLRFILLRSDLS